MGSHLFHFFSDFFVVLVTDGAQMVNIKKPFLFSFLYSIFKFSKRSKFLLSVISKLHDSVLSSFLEYLIKINLLHIRIFINFPLLPMLLNNSIIFVLHLNEPRWILYLYQPMSSVASRFSLSKVPSELLIFLLESLVVRCNLKHILFSLA